MQCQRYKVTDHRVTAIAVAANDCWIVTAAAAEGVWPEVWFVAATYMLDRGNGPTMHVVHWEEAALAQGSRPHSLHISDDHVLAIALGTGGLRLYKLQAPLPPAIERGVSLLKELGSGLFVAWTKWVTSSSRCKVSLVSHAREPCKDRVLAYGSVAESDGDVQEVLTAKYGEVLMLDASGSGWVMVITAGLVMHLLQLQSDARFCVRTVQLGAPRGGPSPLTFRTAAVGSSLVCVGYDTPSGDGLVEVFEADTGDLATWRSLPGRSPTALATCARRVIVGAGRRSAAQSVLYGFVSTRTLCYTVASGGMLQGDWMPGTVVLDEDRLVFAQMLDKGGLVVDHWFPSAR